MSQPDQSRFGVSAEDLRKYDWQARLGKAEQRDCWEYCSALASAANECNEAGDSLGKRVYEFLYTLAFFLPNYDTTGNPYGPRWTEPNGNRALMAEDLTDSDLTTMQDIVEEIVDPEYRARVADLLWEGKRDYKAALIAVDAYIEAAEKHKTDYLWPPYVERLERAIQLAAEVAFGKDLHNKVLCVIESAIQEFQGNLKSGLLCLRLIEIALAHTKGKNAKVYAGIAEQLAKQFQSGDTDRSFSENYWQLAAECHQYAKNPTEAQRCKLALAECYVTNVETSLTNSQIDYGNAAHWMGVAVQCLRDARAPQERINEIHKRFLALERLFSENGIKSIGIDVDKIPGFRDEEAQTKAAAKKIVSGYDFPQAVGRLARITSPVEIGKVQNQVKSNASEYVFNQFFPSGSLDAAGKVTDVMPAMAFSSNDEAATALRKETVLQMREVHWKLEAEWKIDPARQAIIEQHAVRMYSLAFLVQGNPFICPGHEGIFLRGIQAGFFGDWLLAMHLLIPQIEASLRHVLQQNGIVTSTLKPNGIQAEKDLNEILWMPEMERVFGPDITFNLRGILIERFGYNMRNEMAHGLMSEGAFYHTGSVYLWWLTLQLCWFGPRFVPAPPKAS